MADSGEIRYTYPKLKESAKTIKIEKDQVLGNDKEILAKIKDEVDGFKSEYATWAGKTLANMLEVKSEDLVRQLDEYSTVLDAVCETMKEAEKKVADSYSYAKGGAA
jgi:uncharacterized protein YukE